MLFSLLLIIALEKAIKALQWLLLLLLLLYFLLLLLILFSLLPSHLLLLHPILFLSILLLIHPSSYPSPYPSPYPLLSIPPILILCFLYDKATAPLLSLR